MAQSRSDKAVFMGGPVVPEVRWTRRTVSGAVDR
jgi:hypothetical protein